MHGKVTAFRGMECTHPFSSVEEFQRPTSSRNSYADTSRTCEGTYIGHQHIQQGFHFDPCTEGAALDAHCELLTLCPQKVSPYRTTAINGNPSPCSEIPAKATS
ncbi:hypothetical protein WJX77_006775 [Trebouxia sp. C0004]